MRIACVDMGVCELPKTKPINLSSLKPDAEIDSISAFRIIKSLTVIMELLMNTKEIIKLLSGLNDEQLAAIKAAAVPAVDETAAVAELTSSEKITVKVTSGKVSVRNFAEVRRYCGGIAGKFIGSSRVGYDVRSKVDEGDGKTVVLTHKITSVLSDAGIKEVMRIGIAADARALAKACGIQCGDCSSLESARKAWNSGVEHIRGCVRDNGAYNPKKVLDEYCNAASDELKVMVNDLADAARKHFRTSAPKAWSALLGKEVPAFHEGDRSSEMMKVLRTGKIKSEIKTGMKASREDEFTDK